MMCVLKNGHKFTFDTDDVPKFYIGLADTMNKNLQASNSFDIQGEFMFNIQEIAAIHPASVDASEEK